MVQLREKDLPSGELYSLAMQVKSAIAGRALFFVNDRVDIALACGADGVQLGELALPVEAVRRIGGGLLIGRSVHSAEGAIQAERAGADLLTVGTIFATPSHPGGRTGGLALVEDVAAAVDTPFLGIGGVDASNSADVVARGAAGVAVISAVGGRGDARGAAVGLLEAMRQGALEREDSAARNV